MINDNAQYTNMKYTTILILATTLLFTLSGCLKSESEVSAEGLLAQAKNAVDASDTSLATTLLDSIDRAYPSETKVRRQALELRPKIVETETLKQIASTDSLLSFYEDQYRMLLEKMKLINDPQLVEPYYVAKKAYRDDFVNTTGIQARVDEIGQFYLISSVKGLNLKHTSVTVTVDSEQASTATIPYDGAANYRIEGSELVTYMTSQCEEIGKFAATHRTGLGKLTFNGAKSHTIQLQPAQISAIADAYEFSQSIVQARELYVQREKLERQLQIARDQQAQFIKTE